MNTPQRQEFVKDIELFRGLSDLELETLVHSIEDISLDRNQYLFKETDQRGALYILRHGEIELTKRNSFGEEKRLSYFNRGDYLGEGSWVDYSLHTTSANAIEDSTLLVLNRNYFEHNGALVLKIFSNITQFISRRMRHANNRMINVAGQYEDSETRREL